MRQPVSPAAQRVLRSLARAEEGVPGGTLPLRKIAKLTLGGDAELAARILSELDLAGLIRTDVMGWHSGRLTTRGREAAQRPKP